MIVFLSTSAHAYTHDPLTGQKRFDFRPMSYTRALRAARLPRATYIFADMDRLGFWELELAARLYRVLRDGGARVLNDPAVVRQRLSLLRELRFRGINQFNAWQADDSTRESRFPVFLRTQSAHRGNLTDLLHNESALKTAIREALSKGIPMREMIVIEYCAEPVGPNLFRKLSTFRVGDRMVSTLCVHESHWTAKHGEQGIAGAELYDDEYAIVAENRWGEPLRPAFEVARIDYGRSDFALVDGRPQVYEINSNPMHLPIGEHPFPIRVQAGKLFEQRLHDAFCEIDTVEDGAPIPVDDEALTAQRGRDRFVVRSRWLP